MRQQRRRRGITMVWAAILMLVFLGFLGLSIDLGHVYLTSHQLQNASDAASLAAARLVREDVTLARVEAVRVAKANSAARSPVQIEANHGNSPDGDVIIGYFDRATGMFTPGESNPNAVRVTARRTANSPGGKVALLFGGIFGVEGADIVRTATALVGLDDLQPGLLLLDPIGAQPLYLQGNATLELVDGTIHINTTHACGVGVSGNAARIYASDIYQHGPPGCAPSGVVYQGQFHPNSNVLPDPLADLPAPPDGQIRQQGSDDTVLLPGYYPNGIEIKNVALTMMPGIYVVEGPGFVVHANGILSANGVLIYVKGGEFNIGSNPNATITPPDPEFHFFEGAETYHHVSVFQARNNATDPEIRGGPGLNLQGTLYFPGDGAGNGPTLKLYGTGAGGFGTQVLTHRLSLEGNVDIDIVYGGQFAEEGHRIVLVR